MRRRKDDAACLWDMLKAARTARNVATRYTREQYDRDELLRLAVERLVEIIGEAARHISEPFKDSHPEVPWRRVTSQRHVLAHEYDSIDPEQIWVLISGRLDALIAALEPLVPTPPDEGASA
jgi:uncharacterized protein with HEPN domain